MRPVIRVARSRYRRSLCGHPCNLSTTMTPVALSATALIMGDDEHPLYVPEDSPDYIKFYVDRVNTDFISPTRFCGDTSCTLVTTFPPGDRLEHSGTGRSIDRSDACQSR